MRERVCCPAHNICYLYILKRPVHVVNSATKVYFTYRLSRICIHYNFIGSLKDLKVGSCPTYDNSVQILFCPFLCSINFIFCIWCCRENPQDFTENSHFFVCLFPLCWNSHSKQDLSQGQDSSPDSALPIT